MTDQALRLADYLGHIAEAIERIQNYTQAMQEAAFHASPMAQDAVIRNFEVIAEASNNIKRVAPEFIAAHPELMLSSAYEMRNVLAHSYFKVDLGIVWLAIQ